MLFLAFIGGFLGGACHCMIPMMLFFPYGTIVVMRTSWQAVGIVLLILQFPLYVILLTSLSGRGRKGLALLVLLAGHAAASVLGLTVFR